jgi:hypothetical protein
MTFDEWYEANKEALTTKNKVTALREAFQAGYDHSEETFEAVKGVFWEPL